MNWPILTSQEKGIMGFVIAAFLLGLGTKCFRDLHPPAEPEPASLENSASSPSAPPAERR